MLRGLQLGMPCGNQAHVEATLTSLSRLLQALAWSPPPLPIPSSSVASRGHLCILLISAPVIPSFSAAAQLLFLLAGLQLGMLCGNQAYVDATLTSLSQLLAGPYQGEGMPPAFLPYVNLHYSLLEVGGPGGARYLERLCLIGPGGARCLERL